MAEKPQWLGTRRPIGEESSGDSISYARSHGNRERATVFAALPLRNLSDGPVADCTWPHETISGHRFLYIVDRQQLTQEVSHGTHVGPDGIECMARFKPGQFETD